MDESYENCATTSYERGEGPGPSARELCLDASPNVAFSEVMS